jgi:deazaflavin-dependent oxidoreductase (nitroreductase family)
MPIGPEEAAWNASTIADFREHGGQITTGRLAGSNLLLLTTRGAKSGHPQTSPLGYSRDGDRYVVVASNSGGSKDPAWVRNVAVNPAVSMEVGTTRFEARATVQAAQERRRLLDSHIAAIPIFARYEAMAGRALPVVTLEPLDQH